MRPATPLAVFAVSAALFALAGCNSPSRPTPAAVNVPAAPAPTPTPTPLPPAMLGCGAPPVAVPAVSCPRTSESYQGYVTEALARLAAERPHLFDVGDRRGALGYLILDHPAYYAGVLDQLRAMGLCAVFDGEEIAVKQDNTFSDQYKIMTSTGHVQTGPSVYRATCRPPAF
jgi:hypothetical protein